MWSRVTNMSKFLTNRISRGGFVWNQCTARYCIVTKFCKFDLGKTKKIKYMKWVLTAPRYTPVTFLVSGPGLLLGIAFIVSGDMWTPGRWTVFPCVTGFITPPLSMFLFLPQPLSFCSITVTSVLKSFKGNLRVNNFKNCTYMLKIFFSFGRQF